METVTENLKETPNSTLSFFKYVFNFDDDNKSEMFNLFQYSFLAIIPLVLVLKVVQQNNNNHINNKISAYLLK